MLLVPCIVSYNNRAGADDGITRRLGASLRTLYARMAKPYRHLAAGVALLLAILTLMQLSLSISPLQLSVESQSGAVYSFSQLMRASAAETTQRQGAQRMSALTQRPQIESAPSLAILGSLDSSSSNGSSVRSIGADVDQWLRRRELLQTRTCPEVEKVGSQRLFALCVLAL